MRYGKGAGVHTILNILDIVFKSDTWYVQFPDFKNGSFSSIDFVFPLTWRRLLHGSAH